MKILLSRLSVNQEVGGAELSARDITRSLVQAGHTPLLLTNLSHGVIVKGLDNSFLHHCLQPRGRTWLAKAAYPFLLLLFFLQLLYIVLKFKPDIINPHSRDDQIVLTLIAKIMGIPIIWRDPGDLTPQLSYATKGVLQKLNKQLQLWAIKHVDHIFTLNQDEYNVILRESGIPSSRLSVIASNILFEDYSLTAKPFPHPSEDTIIGTSCRLDKHKGVQYLLEAYRRLPSDIQASTAIWIVGDGAYRRQLEISSRDLNVHFFGYQDDLSRFLRTFDILVQPSEFEGWGRSVREAMYFGVPAVGSMVGGIKEQIVNSKTGFLFKRGDSQSLEVLLKRLINDAVLREKIGQAAQSSVVASGDWTATVNEELIPLFQRVAKH